MRLPIIKHLNNFASENESNSLETTIAVLENLSECRTIKDEELDVIGELISNLYGAIEVQKSIEQGQSEKDALNQFMQRVLGSIDR